MESHAEALTEVDGWDATGLLDGLEELARSRRFVSRRFALDAVVIAHLAGRVPRVPCDERGATAWTSFVREVAVARRCSDRVATTEVAHAVLLVRMPITLGLLSGGELPVMHVRALLEEAGSAGAAALAAIDAEVGPRAVKLPPGRVREAVRKVLLRVDADAVAARAAAATAGRAVRRRALPDDQAEIVLTGPAVPVAQAYDALDATARALRAAGDGRTLDALRFDLAVAGLLDGAAGRTQSGSAAAAASTAGAVATGDAAGGSTPGSPDVPAAATGDPAWMADRRCARPVRLNVQVPVTTLLGLSQEPGWLDGHGWISAPTCRQLLVSAELRRLCVDEKTGRLLDVTDTIVRPELTPEAVARALQTMASDPAELDPLVWEEQPEHDPSDRLREFVVLRDVLCDGPTGTLMPARRSHLDHDVPYPTGPTAAWNLIARADRTHGLKHRGWAPVRTPTSTVWFSPAGQMVEVALSNEPMHPLDPAAYVPDPDRLHQVDAESLRPPTLDDEPPDW